MDDSFLLEFKVTFDDLLHDCCDFIFSEILFDTFAEIGMAEFCDEVGVVFGGEDIMKREDVRKVLYFFEDVDLRV